MQKIMTNIEFENKLRDIVDNYKTVYMWGVYGAPVTERIIVEKSKQYPTWYTPIKKKLFRSLIGQNYFGFDCVNLIKGVLWCWNGDNTRVFGGAIYKNNGVPDVSANRLLPLLSGISTDFKKIEVGEVVWMPGHVGVYMGIGEVIECSPAWKNSVQVTACHNIGKIKGLNGRIWTKHGKLPYITYER